MRNDVVHRQGEGQPRRCAVLASGGPCHGADRRRGHLPVRARGRSTSSGGEEGTTATQMQRRCMKAGGRGRRTKQQRIGSGDTALAARCRGLAGTGAGARRGRLGRRRRLGGDWALGLLPWLEADKRRGRRGEEKRGDRAPAAASACGNEGGRDRAGREMGIGEESREMVRRRW